MSRCTKCGAAAVACKEHVDLARSEGIDTGVRLAVSWLREQDRDKASNSAWADALEAAMAEVKS